MAMKLLRAALPQRQCRLVNSGHLISQVIVRFGSARLADHPEWLSRDTQTRAARPMLTGNHDEQSKQARKTIGALNWATLAQKVAALFRSIVLGQCSFGLRARSKTISLIRAGRATCESLSLAALGGHALATANTVLRRRCRDSSAERRDRSLICSGESLRRGRTTMSSGCLCGQDGWRVPNWARRLIRKMVGRV